MSPYTQTLAQLRLSALQALQDALNATTDPAELRRIAVAIFNAPAPDDDIDAAITFTDDPQPPDEPTTPGPLPAEEEQPPAPETAEHPTSAPTPDISHPTSHIEHRPSHIEHPTTLQLPSQGVTPCSLASSLCSLSPQPPPPRSPT